MENGNGRSIVYGPVLFMTHQYGKLIQLLYDNCKEHFMNLVTKKRWYLDYLLILVGTGLMALAINSVFDATGLVTGGFSGIAILKRWYSPLAHKYYAEYSSVYPGM